MCIIWTLFVCVIFSLPNVLPVTPRNMNYAPVSRISFLLDGGLCYSRVCGICKWLRCSFVAGRHRGGRFLCVVRVIARIIDMITQIFLDNLVYGTLPGLL